MRRTRHRPGHAVRDVLRRQRGHLLVHGCCPLLVAGEADPAELRLYQSWGDFDDPDRQPQEFSAERSCDRAGTVLGRGVTRSEEHTSELQSQSNLVCRLLLEKKKKQKTQQIWRV